MKHIFTFLDTHLLRWGSAFALLFIALYPKLPTIYIHHTWVYIRLEDFLLSVLLGYYLFMLLRKKITFPFSVGAPILLYWIIGLLSLLNSIIFIAPSISNFFPSVAVLSYLRRIEYMGLFFVGVASIRSVNDLKFYFRTILITLGGVLVYGFGQKFYTFFWQLFPSVAQKFPFCFPSFQTGNEEFAKGIPLCLPFDSRITSTFAGHYDLAMWLVFFIPIIFTVSFTYRMRARIGLWIMGIMSVMLLTFTSSRVSIIAYFLGVGVALVLIKQKKAILPLFIISAACVVLFGGTTLKRLAQTFRTESVVTDSQGKVVGYTSDSLPQNLKNKISANPDGSTDVAAPPPSQNLPVGNSYITLPQNTKNTQKTNVAVVQKSLSANQAKQLQYDFGGVQISTVSGNFTVQKVLVYDISFTTRTQGEWPSAWKAFLRNPFLGSGFATITLAADNDYLRNLGETGLLGILSFLFVFLVVLVLMKQGLHKITNPLVRAFMLGAVGGLIGLFANSIFYDTFEASKVAETVWIIFGLMAGTLLLVKEKSFSLYSAVKSIVTSPVFLMFYILVVIFAITLPFMSNFFVADDFTWLHWAVTSGLQDILHFFVNAQGFFYRPIDRILMIGLFALFGFDPSGYHVFFTLIHFSVAVCVYALLIKLFNKKTIAFVGALLFAVLAGHAENIYWISSLSITLSTLFILIALLSYIRFRESDNVMHYIMTFLVTGLALGTYEMAVIAPLLYVLSDIYLTRQKKESYIKWYVPFILLDVLYLIVRFTANVAPIGGDYSYNLPHLIPNIFGNLVGYIGLFIFGQNVFGPYVFLREGVRHNNIILFGSLIVAAIILGVVTLFRKNVVSLLSSYKNLSFGLSFAIISLLPFIGLGNITERYMYLGSVGFIIVVMWIVSFLEQKLDSKVGFMILSFAVVVGFVYQGYMLSVVGAQWKHAGVITQNTLGFFKAKYPILTQKDTIYINNLPIRQANAWIFPVGLPDGLWFVYRDLTPHVIVTTSNNPVTPGQGRPYVFTFNADGIISETK